ncbi:drug:proton antiporter [Rhizobium sp. LjRoot98]|uniref:VOC family protein n=1 Tax=unclassified Rhizobium TaxID=2613769 RepID=UPI0007138421|nr:MULTISPECIES: VOC family protein [unclassified Rhizobium]KQV38962.1 drug:proton antiporter [Rhizobium sp. Root1204]KQY15992.1 drug:proton antiporter [Rhizobium sp. Root1334]KRC10168.1 drug:proton antiporter [Rhizobium sp. Root73]
MKTDFVLPVDSPAESAVFYMAMFGALPLELSPTYAVVLMNDALKLGLAKRKRLPAAVNTNDAELPIFVAGREGVDALHDEWRRKGVTILQEPVSSDSDYTFICTDPDGHRLRVFTPQAA